MQSTKVQGMHRQTLGLHKRHPQCKGEQEGVSGEDYMCTSPIPGLHMHTTIIYPIKIPYGIFA
jgi:hypothetical protein